MPALPNTTTPSTTPPNPLLIVLAFAAIYVIWGTTYLAMKIGVETIPPFMMAGVRFLAAGACLFAFLKFRGAAWPTASQWKASAIVGACFMVGGNGLVTFGEQKVASGTASLIVATMPLWMVVLNFFLFDRKRPDVRIISGLLLGFLGTSLLILGKNGPESGTGDFFYMAVLIMAPAFWAVGSLVSRNADLPTNPFLSTSMQMLCGGAMLLGLSCLTGEPFRFDPREIALESLLAVVYLAIFGAIIALSAYVWLLDKCDPSKVATYTYVNPIIAVLLGWLVKDETLSMITVLAVVLILAAVFVISWKPNRKKTTATQQLAKP